ncbi:hypothetical protein ACHAW5_007994 [Stephanodiscus triporus]|uniref:Uncharacterized protein n=1 Tax=Stephanodiscus triporus TaxID=2934178 RepID=A0ABD3PDF3_9STRA
MMSSIVRSTMILLAVAAHIYCADSLSLPYNFIGDSAVGSSAFCMINHGMNLMKPLTVKISKTLLFATIHAGGNVIPLTTNSVVPPLLVVQGEEVAMTPSPTALKCPALDVYSSASHLDALYEDEESASTFEEAILRGLGGADANRMPSQTLESTKTRTLEEIFAGGDNAQALGNEEEFALSLAYEKMIRRLEETTCKASNKIPTYLGRDTLKPSSDPNPNHIAEGIEDFLLSLALYAAVLFAVISMMIYKILGATCPSKFIVSGRGKTAIQPSTVLTFFTAVACFSGHAHAQEIEAAPKSVPAPCYGSYSLPETSLDGVMHPFINGTIDQAGDGWGENIKGWNGTEYPTISFVQVYLYISGDQNGQGTSALAGQAFVGFGFPYLCVAAYLDNTTTANTNCNVEESADSAWVNYNTNNEDKLKNSTPGANFRYVKYSSGTSGRTIGK